MKYEVEGVVESNSRDGKSIKVNGVWYSSFKPIDSAVAWKDEVKFNCEEKEKPSGGDPYRNIKGVVTNLSTGATVDTFKGTTTGATKVPASGGAKAGAPTSAPRINFPIPPTDRDRSIIRRHAVSAATEYLSAFKDITKHTIGDVIDVARTIENYTSGDELTHLLEDNEES
jgi:hypothetical protein